MKGLFTMQNCNCGGREPQTPPCNLVYDLDRLPLGMAYVPWQQFDAVYEAEKALGCGTIFPELYKPFLGKRGAMR